MAFTRTVATNDDRAWYFGLRKLLAFALVLALFGSGCESSGDDSVSTSSSNTEQSSAGAETVGASLISHLSFDDEAANWLVDLSADEQTDQVRDWVRYGFAAALDLDPERASGFLYDKVPVRDPLFRDVADDVVGPGRFVPDIDEEMLYILVDEADLHRDRTVALMLDDHLTEAGSDLDDTTIVSYSVDLKGQRVEFGSPEVSSTRDARREHGWTSRSIGDLDDLDAFNSEIDHLAQVWVEDDEVWMAGWRWSGVDIAPVSLQDIAVLSASYSDEFAGPSGVASPGFSLDPAGEIVDDFAILSAFIPEAQPWLFDWLDVIVLLNNADLTEGEIDELIAEEPEFVIAYEVAYFIEQGAFAEEGSTDLIEAADWLEIEPDRAKFWALRSYSLGRPVGSIARYEGATQGTEVGMTLFYTDLIAKDWSGGVGDGVPSDNGIDAFVTSQNLATNWSYCPSFAEAGRLWFGLDTSALAADEQRLFLGSITTRLFSRADAADGSAEEVEPSYHFGASLDWWDRNYALVADYEPQYQRLDQIMRWSAALAWMSEIGVAIPTLDPVDEGLRYEAWVGDRQDLREQALPLMVNVGEGREVVVTTPSAPFEECGVAFVAGGVTLAPSRVLQSVRSISDGVSRAFQRSRTIQVTPRAGGVTAYRSAVYDDFGQLVRVVDRSVTPGQGSLGVEVNAFGRTQTALGRVYTPGSATSTRSFTLDHVIGESRWTTNVSASGTQVGRLGTRIENGGVSLTWTPGVAANLRSFVSRLQDRLSSIRSGSHFDEAIRSLDDVDRVVHDGASRYVHNNGQWFEVAREPSAGTQLSATVNRLVDDFDVEPWHVRVADDASVSRLDQLTNDGFRSVQIGRRVENVKTSEQLAGLVEQGHPVYSIIDDGRLVFDGLDVGIRVRSRIVELEPHVAAEAIVLDGASAQYGLVGTPVVATLATAAILIEPCAADDEAGCVQVG